MPFYEFVPKNSPSDKGHLSRSTLGTQATPDQSFRHVVQLCGCDEPSGGSILWSA